MNKRFLKRANSDLFLLIFDFSTINSKIRNADLWYRKRPLCATSTVRFYIMKWIVGFELVFFGLKQWVLRLEGLSCAWNENINVGWMIQIPGNVSFKMLLQSGFSFFRHWYIYSRYHTSTYRALLSKQKYIQPIQCLSIMYSLLTKDFRSSTYFYLYIITSEVNKPVTCLPNGCHYIT